MLVLTSKISMCATPLDCYLFHCRSNNRRGQLVISLLLPRLVREPVGVKQLHQLPPELAHLGGFPGGEFLLLRQRRRGLRIFLLILRARLPVFLLGLPGVFDTRRRPCPLVYSPRPITRMVLRASSNVWSSNNASMVQPNEILRLLRNSK